jgi:hypothetical protein
MKSFLLKPAVPGDNSNSSADWSVHPPIIHQLRYEFDFLLDDVLFASFPSWIVTVPAKVAIQSAGLSGVSFEHVEVSKSPDFEEIEPDQDLPEFAWLKVNGKAGRDDFGIAHDTKLVVSERALKLLKRLGIPNAKVSEFEE